MRYPTSTFSERFLSTLNALQITTWQFVELTEISLERMSELCNDGSPTEEELVRLAHGLDCSAMWLKEGQPSLAAKRLSIELEDAAQQGRTALGRVVVEHERFERIYLLARMVQGELYLPNPLPAVERKS